VALMLGIAVAARADEELDYGLEERSVAGLRVQGVESFDEDRILSLLPFSAPSWYRLGAPRYTPDLLALGVDAIRGFYRREGFHEVSVSSRLESRDPVAGDRIVVEVVEGPRTTVAAVDFRGDSPLDEERLRAVLVHPPGGPAPFLQAEYGRDVYALRAAHLSAGYLGCRILLSIQEEPRRRRLVFTIIPGPAYRIQAIEVEGQREVREAHIRRELRMKPGQVFSLDRIVRTEADLLETGWFRDVSFEPAHLDTTAGTCDLVLTVVERPSGYYEVGVGAGDEDQLRLSAAWGDRNVFRSGKGLALRTRFLWGFDDVLDLGRKLVFDHREEISYTHRRFLGSRYTLRLSGFFDRESRGASGVAIERLGVLANTTLWRYRTRQLDFEIAHELVRKVVLDAVKNAAGDVERDLSAARSITNSFSFVWSRDTRDDIFAPHTGSLRQILWQTAGGPVLGGDNSFHKAVGTWTGFLGHDDGSVLALRLQTGWADAWYESSGRGALGVPLEDRFFAGGQRSVRGYRENSLGPRLTEADQDLVIDDRFLLNRPAAGGKALLLLNAELRLPLPLLSRWGFGAIVFADGGNVWEDWSKVQWEDFRPSSDPDGPDPTTLTDLRTSVGFGLLYNTPVGPLRLEYGLPLKRARLVGEEGDTSEVDPHHLWHFSLGFAF
jgi:outer membrane protein insertion porin family